MSKTSTKGGPFGWLRCPIPEGVGGGGYLKRVDAIPTVLLGTLLIGIPLERDPFEMLYAELHLKNSKKFSMKDLEKKWSE